MLFNIIYETGDNYLTWMLLELLSKNLLKVTWIIVSLPCFIYVKWIFIYFFLQKCLLANFRNCLILFFFTSFQCWQFVLLNLIVKKLVKKKQCASLRLTLEWMWKIHLNHLTKEAPRSYENETHADRKGFLICGLENRVQNLVSKL